ncbi:nuclear transport factor 2 family protein [Piscibacillus sp. B03]|uniref:nuclear transport factor 2 family protein n=1 Tax=Piscibacillus sp. B03 TaxID=3457430 RepID=UPI003FCD09DF
MTDLKKYLKGLEEQLLLKQKEDFEELLAEDFFEYGSSGNTYNKEDQLAAFKGDNHERHVVYQLSNFDMTQLAADVAHVTYKVFNEQTEQYSLRSSIWREYNGKWQMFFHQGTVTR